MKLFGQDKYLKPGKGVDKNEKPKPPFLRFFIVLWNKRWGIMAINFIYVVFNLLMLLIAYGIFTGCLTLYGAYYPESSFMAELAKSSPLQMEIYWKAIIFFVSFLTSIPVFCIGPTRAGFTYIFKSYYKSEPCFLWSDFITKSRSNMKLSITTSILSFVSFTLVCFSAAATFIITRPENGIPFAICFTEWVVVFFFAALVLMLNLYVYPMMVTFNVTFKQLLKNSFILCIIKWFRNLITLILDAVIIALPLLLLPMTNYIVFVLSIVLYFALVPGIITLINMFMVYPVLKKYLIDNENADKSEKKAEPEKNIEENKSQGRFENGMWIED